MNNQNINKSNLGKRILAGIIDYGIIFCYMFMVMYFYGTPDDVGGYTVNGLPALSIFLFWGFITIGVEQIWGATVGNYLNHLKPVSLDKMNENISFTQSLKRHSLDVIDLSFFGLIGILLISRTDNHQRLGDLWANTIVVESK